MWKRTVSESWESEKQGRRGFPSLNNERKKVTDKPHLRPLTKNYPDWDTMVGSPACSACSPLCAAKAGLGRSFTVWGATSGAPLGATTSVCGHTHRHTQAHCRPLRPSPWQRLGAGWTYHIGIPPGDGEAHNCRGDALE